MPPDSPPTVPPQPQPQPVSTEQAFDFIMNPAQPPSRRKLSLPSSPVMRISVIAGGLLVLLIFFMVIKSILGGSNLTPFVGIAQEQQELIHLSTTALQQQDLSVTNQNFAATSQLSLGSSQSAIVAYLKTSKTKVGSKQLNLKVSTSIDTQLTAAGAAGTYNQTFQEVMKSRLTTYTSDLKKVYKTAGKKGRALLSSDYNQAQLLSNQLVTVSN